jgi:hypothetical protein
MARKTRAAAAAAMTPVKMDGDGVEEEDIGFVDSFKYLGFHFENRERRRSVTPRRDPHGDGGLGFRAAAAHLEGFAAVAAAESCGYTARISCLC